MLDILHPDSWAEVLQGLVDGAVSIIRVERRDAPITEKLFVRPLDLKAVAEKFRDVPPPADIRVSCKAAGQLTGVYDAFFSRAVSAGLLRGHALGRAIFVDLRDLFEFRRSFMASEEVGSRLGVSARAVAPQLAVRGIRPAGKIGKVSYWPKLAVAALATGS